MCCSVYVKNCPLTGWLYVKSPAEFRRQLDVDEWRAAAGVDADATNTTDALPMLSLTVGVRDGGSPPRTTTGRLTLVVDTLATDTDGEPVIIPSLSSSYNLTWSQRLFIVVASALGAALLATVVFTVVVSQLQSLP